MTIKLKWLGSLLVVLILISAGAWYYTTVFLPKQLAEKTAAAFQKTFGFTPEVRHADKIIVGKAASILELATVSKPLTVDYTYTYQPLPFLTRSLTVRGVFTAKAGYDLNEKFSLVIQDNPLRAVGVFPKPKLLSLEMMRYETLDEKGLLFNSLTPDERDYALRETKTRAHFAVLESRILLEADSAFQAKLHTNSDFNRVEIQSRSE
jgi:hypothetical protein